MLRITGVDQLRRKQFEYQCLERVAALGIVMPTPPVRTATGEDVAGKCAESVTDAHPHRCRLRRVAQQW